MASDAEADAAICPCFARRVNRRAQPAALCGCPAPATLRALGRRPYLRIMALLRALSDAYPTSLAIFAIGSEVPASRLRAIVNLRSARNVMGATPARLRNARTNVARD